jgi:ABC-type branched-subunit amino acid transport system substrate-binding protein
MTIAINAGNALRDEDGISIGVLFSQTGPMAVTEIAHLKGTLLAIEEINASGGVNGQRFLPIIEEPASNPATYRELARKLVAKDRVSVIFGCCSSASRKAVLPVVERYGALLFYPSFYEGFEYSPNVIYTGATANQMVPPLANFLYQNYGKKFCLVGSDYIYPREINRILKEFLADSDGIVTSETYVRQGAEPSEFNRIEGQILDGSPDVILSTVVGSDTSKLYEAHGLAGLQVPLASLTTTESELVGVAEKFRAGHITAAAYFQSIQTPENLKFVANYKSRFGADDVPCVYSETAYFQVLLYAQALTTSGDDSPAAIAQALAALRMKTPQGNIHIDSETNHTHLIPRIGRSNKDGLFDILWQATESVKPDPYLVSYDRTITTGVQAGMMVGGRLPHAS